MIKAALAIEAVRNVSGSNDKMYVLEQYGDVPGFKEILRFIYNPYLRTGISDKKLDSCLMYNSGQLRHMDETAYDAQQIMQYLTEHNTGSDADVWQAAKFLNRVKDESHNNPVVMNIARAIITQNLQIGVTATTLNKVFGSSFIPKVGCILGKKYSDVPSSRKKWPYIVTEKLDGNRRILVKDGKSRCYTRSGHEDAGLVEILVDMQHLPNGYAYDCELLAIGDFKDSIALRQATASIANQKGVKLGLTANLFDMVPVDEFYAGRSRDGALLRKIRLGATLGDDSISLIDEDWPRHLAAFSIERELTFIKSVPILALAHSMDEVTPIAEELWSRGKEGVMLNSVNGLYELKRSNDLLKLKKVKEFSLNVVDLQEGEGKYAGMLGAAVVNYKGHAVRVGSGFTDYQRLRYWNHPEEILDHVIEVESFGESTNMTGGVSLNCPIFKRIAGEVD